MGGGGAPGPLLDRGGLEQPDGHQCRAVLAGGQPVALIGGDVARIPVAGRQLPVVEGRIAPAAEQLPEIARRVRDLSMEYAGAKQLGGRPLDQNALFASSKPDLRQPKAR